MAEDVTDIVVMPEGQLYVAPLGTTMPTDESGALDAAFQELGLVTEDGVAFRSGLTVERVRAWQRFEPVKTIPQSRDTQMQFALMQFNEITFPVAFGGGSVTEPTPGHFKYDVPDPEAGVAEYILVMDGQAGDNDYRFLLRRVTLADQVETAFSRNAPALLPLTFDVLGPESGASWTFFTNDPAFEIGS